MLGYVSYRDTAYLSEKLIPFALTLKNNIWYRYPLLYKVSKILYQNAKRIFNSLNSGTPIPAVVSFDSVCSNAAKT
jgi:hypothetical protein